MRGSQHVRHLRGNEGVAGLGGEEPALGEFSAYLAQRALPARARVPQLAGERDALAGRSALAIARGLELGD
jgi:hypothetical protein